MNYVLQHKQVLSSRNYILHPERARAYWANISRGPLNRYLDQCGDAFNIVIVRSSTVTGDFYAVPFRVLKSVLVDEYLTGDRTGRARWTVYIQRHQLKVGTGPAIDVGRFYGNIAALTTADDVEPNSSDDANDYAIENRKIEIEQRQKQSLFRKRVMQNFDGQCCLSEINEDELLVASHIIPWSVRVDCRLDPSNGLLLYCPYDRLFDKGFFSFNDQLQVILAPGVEQCSTPLRSVLMEIDGRQARQPVEWAIKPEYLSYHRTEVLRTEFRAPKRSLLGLRGTRKARVG